MDLIVYWGDRQIERITLPWIKGEMFGIGRTSENELVLDNRGISRQHAIITVRGEADYVITDNDSLNGTLVNGRRIDSDQEIKFGDKISIGRFELLVVCSKKEQPIQKETKESLKGGSMTKRMPLPLEFVCYLAYGFFVGLGLFWASGLLFIVAAIAFIFMMIKPLWFRGWLIAFAAIMHGVGFGLYLSIGPRSFGPLVGGIIVAVIFALIYLVPWYYRRKQVIEKASSQPVRT
jgi:hypothetical protein